MRQTSILLLALTIAGALPHAFAQSEYFVYIGTYTRQNSKGIYGWRFQPKSGKLTPLDLVAETSNPSFLAVHPNHKFLYAVNENNTFEGKPGGSVTAFSIDATSGKLTQINQVSTKGPGPCHLALDKTGKWLFAANYGGGSVAAYPVQADGKLGEATDFVQHAGSSVNRQRQAGPHAHSTVLAPDNRVLWVADLGLDEVLSYRIGDGKLKPNDPPFAKVTPGSGPRHIAFRPDGKFAYVASEMTYTVTAFRYDKTRDSMEPIQTVSMLPPDFKGNNSAAEIAVHPNGKFVYASNRGDDSLAIFAIDKAKGTLKPVDRVSTQGKTPRNFAIDPTGKWLFAANQDSASVVVFRLDPKTGKLTPAGEKLEVPFPVCVTFAPAARGRM